MNINDYIDELMFDSTIDNFTGDGTCDWMEEEKDWEEVPVANDEDLTEVEEDEINDWDDID